jgi:DNA polymerase-4
LRPRLIAHIDLDSFFVSAERTLRPELQGKPVAVGGTHGRGVISSASYEARRFGVRSAMPVRQALLLCPKLLIVKSNFSLYSELSRKVFELLEKASPLVEATGIDEGYFDLTGTEKLLGDPTETLRRLQAEIRETLGLPCSFGLASNRRVAKIATEDAKPNGIFEVKAGDEAAFLAPKPVRALPGVGPKLEAWLRSRGVRTIAQLQAFPPEVLSRHLGAGGQALALAARGEGSTEFHREAKSPGASRERTFGSDLRSRELLQDELRQLCLRLASDLRKEGKQGRVLKLKIRYADFTTLSRQVTLTEGSRDPEVLLRAASEIFELNWEKGRPVRLLGVGVTLAQSPLGRATEQLGLFPDAVPSESEGGPSGLERLSRALDQLEERFGREVAAIGRIPGESSSGELQEEDLLNGVPG